MSRLVLLLAVGACALLALPSIASAHHPDRGLHKGLHKTYPHAARLCEKSANGHLPKRLASQADKVAAACAALKTSFDAAQAAYKTATDPLKKQADDAIAAARAACQQAKASHEGHRSDDPACKTARESARTTIKGLRDQLRAAKKTYRDAVNAARKTFWDAIRALRGGATVAHDRHCGPGPATTLPSAPTV
jgi:hypothetical protein